jgi:hypothetical protein
MRRLQERLLEQAQQQRRFHPQQSQYHILKIREVPTFSQSPKPQLTTHTHHSQGNVTHISPLGSPSPNTHTTMPPDWQTAFTNTWNDNTPNQSTLNCIFQPTRPHHISGIPDPLPFASKSEAQTVFATLRLPPSYSQIAQGTAGSAQAHTTRNHSSGAPESFEFIAHYTSRQPSWSLSLSHDPSNKVTSVFWSVEAKMDSAALLEDLRDFERFALHPMLVPCIMYAANLRMNEERRRSIKTRVAELENSIRGMIQREASSPPPSSSSYSFDRDNAHKNQDCHGEQAPPSLETYFQVLHSCRKDQSSRKGRYRFWRNFVEALEEGFEYVEALMAESDSPDVYLLEAHRELQRWVKVNDKKLESLMARDEDHVCRVDNVSHMVCCG